MKTIRYFFAKKINGSKNTGVIDIKDNKVICLCTEKESKKIIEALKTASSDEPTIINEDSGKQLAQKIYNMLTDKKAQIRPSALRIEDMIKAYAVRMCEEQRRICKDYMKDCHLPLDLIG